MLMPSCRPAVLPSHSALATFAILTMVLLFSPSLRSEPPCSCHGEPIGHELLAASPLCMSPPSATVSAKTDPIAEMKRDPDAAGDFVSQRDRQIQILTRFVCNDDFVIDNVSIGDPKTNQDRRREQESTYVLIYGGDGDVMANGQLANRKQDWQSMRLIHRYDGDLNPPIHMYAPQSLFRLNKAADQWAAGKIGMNPNITFERLQVLKLKKNAW